MKLPIFLKKYFEDTEFSKLDDKKNDTFIIARILKNGGLEAARWMMKHYTKKEVAKIVKRSEDLSAKSTNFWCLAIHIPRGEWYLKRPNLKIPNIPWPY